MKTLRDKVIVITGASSGIGEAMAKEYAAQGAKVVLGARDAFREEIRPGVSRPDVLSGDVPGARFSAEITCGDMSYGSSASGTPVFRALCGPGAASVPTSPEGFPGPFLDKFRIRLHKFKVYLSGF